MLQHALLRAERLVQSTLSAHLASWSQRVSSPQLGPVPLSKNRARSTKFWMTITRQRVAHPSARGQRTKPQLRPTQGLEEGVRAWLASRSPDLGLQHLAGRCSPEDVFHRRLSLHRAFAVVAASDVPGKAECVQESPSTVSSRHLRCYSDASQKIA